jgi:hypothetical protein
VRNCIAHDEARVDRAAGTEIERCCKLDIGRSAGHIPGDLERRLPWPEGRLVAERPVWRPLRSEPLATNPRRSGRQALTQISLHEAGGLHVERTRHGHQVTSATDSCGANVSVTRGWDAYAGAIEHW